MTGEASERACRVVHSISSRFFLKPFLNLLVLLLLLSLAPRAAAQAPVVSGGGAFTPIAPLPFARSDHTATAMPDGLIYLLGGCDGAQNCANVSGTPEASLFCFCSSFTASVTIYDPARDAYAVSTPAAPLPPMPAPRYRHLACALRDVIFVFGGRDLATDAIITQVDAFNVTARAWLPSAQLAAYPADLGSDNSCSSLADGASIVVLGGYTGNYAVSLATIYVFRPFAGGDLSAGGAGVWSRRAAQLATGRGDFSSVELGGLVHVYGGYSVAQGFCAPLGSHEVYDPAADAVAPGAPLPHALAEKDDGVALGGAIFSIGGETKSVATGCGDADIVALTAVYALVPAAGAAAAATNWTTAAALPSPRMRFASAVVGNVIFTFGGQGPLVDGGSATPFLPILYSALSFSLGAPPSATAAGGGGAAASFGPGSIVGAVLGTAAAMLLVQAGLSRWRVRTAGGRGLVHGDGFGPGGGGGGFVAKSPSGGVAGGVGSGGGIVVRSPSSGRLPLP